MSVKGNGDRLKKCPIYPGTLVKAMRQNLNCGHRITSESSQCRSAAWWEKGE